MDIMLSPQNSIAGQKMLILSEYAAPVQKRTYR